MSTTAHANWKNTGAACPNCGSTQTRRLVDERAATIIPFIGGVRHVIPGHKTVYMKCLMRRCGYQEKCG